jgi:polyisoprenoid-binding protein YceI
MSIRTVRSLAIAAAGLLLACVAAAAQQEAFQLEPSQSKVEFTLGDVLHTVHGTFQLRPGTIQFDPATGRASGELILDANTGDSGNQSRDRRMKKDILETEKYPEIVFTAQQIRGEVAPDGTSRADVLGTMTLHGQDHPMTLAIQFTRQGGSVVADTSFVVPYVQWGLKNPSTLFLRVSDKVDISVHAVGRVAPAPGS